VNELTLSLESASARLARCIAHRRLMLREARACSRTSPLLLKMRGIRHNHFRDSGAARALAGALETLRHSRGTTGCEGRLLCVRS